MSFWWHIAWFSFLIVLFYFSCYQRHSFIYVFTTVHIWISNNFIWVQQGWHDIVIIVWIIISFNSICFNIWIGSFSIIWVTIFMNKIISCQYFSCCRWHTSIYVCIVCTTVHIWISNNIIWVQQGWHDIVIIIWIIISSFNCICFNTWIGSFSISWILHTFNFLFNFDFWRTI